MVLPVSGKGNHLLLGVLGQRKGPQGLIWAKKVPESGLSMVTSHQGATAPQFTAGAVTKEEDLVTATEGEKEERECQTVTGTACVT